MGGGHNHGQLAIRPSEAYQELAPMPIGQRIPNIYIARIAQFTSRGQYEHQNLLS
jgi:hypothetical protein